MRVTGLGKGSLYNAFGSKRDLYLRIFAEYCKDVVDQSHRALAGGLGASSPSPLERLERYGVTLTRGFGMESPRRGCLLSKATAELAGTDQAVAVQAGHAFDSLAETFGEAVREAQNADEVDPHADPKTLGYLLLSIATGIDCMARADVDKSALTAAAQAAIALLARSAH
jgi:TetR/AcrR family transcriptional repressor of nem operon